MYGFYLGVICCVKTYEADLFVLLFSQESIQQETHDSIEDAVTALKLWRKWQEYEDAGVVETMLNDVYSRGSMVGFKAPGSGGRIGGGGSRVVSGSFGGGGAQGGGEVNDPLTTPKKGGSQFGSMGFRSPLRR